MANTAEIRKSIEPFVLGWLEKQFGQQFSEQAVRLATNKIHKADAVSSDGTIVVNILSNGGPRTRGGRPNIGGLRKAENDFWRLANLAEPRVNRRLLVFTSSGFMDAVSNTVGDPGLMKVEFQYCPLSAELQKLLDSVIHKASIEQRAATDGL